MLTADQFVGRDDGPLEQQRQDNHVSRRNCTFPLILRKNQSPNYKDDDFSFAQKDKKIIRRNRRTFSSLRAGSFVCVGYRGQRRQRHPRTGEAGERNEAGKSERVRGRGIS